MSWSTRPRRSSSGPRHALLMAPIVLLVVAAWSLGPAPAAQSVSVASVSAAQGPGNLSALSLNQVLTLNQPAVDQWGHLVYDTAAGYAVLFGGTDPTNLQSPEETWTYSHGVWTDLTGSLNISPDLWNPAGASMTYDSADHEILLVGPPLSNVTQEQTWAFRGGEWFQLHPTTEPTARWYAAFAYDIADQEALLYGGLSLDGSGYNQVWLSDTWALSNGNWSLVDPNGPSGPYQTLQSMAYDPANNLTVLLNSSTVNGQVSTSVFQGGAWQNQYAAPSNPGGPLGENGGMVFDPSLGEIVDINGCNSWWNQTTQLWITDGSTWTSQVILGGFDQLCGQSSLTYDAGDGYVLLTSPALDLNVTGPNHVTQTWKLDRTQVGQGPTLALALSPSSPAEGQTMEFAATVTGGYGYIWHILTSTAPGCGAVSNVTTLSCLATSTGTYTATFTAEDQAGRIATTTISFTIVELPSSSILWTAVGVGGVLAASVFAWSRRRRPSVSR